VAIRTSSGFAGAIFSGPGPHLWKRGGVTMSFGLYAAGFGVVIVGLVYGAYLMHVPSQWIAVGAVILVGVGILTGVKATRQKDPPT
jgi:hypothetical protein